MTLKIMVPNRILVDQEARKVSAEAQNGSFTILPRHIDSVAALVPGILSFTAEDGKEVFLAVDEGLLVKCAEDVAVATADAVQGENLETLHRALREQFLGRDERRRRSRTVLSRLETTLARRFMEMTKNAE